MCRLQKNSWIISFRQRQRTKGGSEMITVGAFLSYAYTGMQIQRFDEKKQEYDGLYSIDEFVQSYRDERIKWFSVTNGCGYLVIALEEAE